ncbi:MAG: gliding motility-associated protein GldE [Saprospiraceae bacterium]|nr:gliding motility-associated protein GldE [Saprospiraceae bacterium]
MVSCSIGLLILLCCSALVSGSEVAFFSLSPNDLDSLEKEGDKLDQVVLKLRSKPRKLLATILISNNFINIAIVILSDFLIRNLLGDELLLKIGGWFAQYVPLEAMSLGRVVNFLITIVGVTFFLVLFGEVAPKVYANLNNKKFARLMARPMYIMALFFTPVSRFLVNWSSKMESQFIYQKSGLDDTSKEELDKAIQLTVNNIHESEEADMLRGIIKFGNVSAKQIMRSRVDVVAVEKEDNFKELMALIKESGYSRIPVYKEDFDEIIGILYAKDLLGCSNEDASFDWQQFIRENVLYVPESKKIDDLLKEFQQKRMHMAVVVDEFGGSAGIVTLEDIMEEVIGEIKDEFDDEEEVDFIKINDSNYIFDGKSLLNDVARIMGLEKGSFDTFKGNADSLAGMMLTHFGLIPKKDRELIIHPFRFRIVSVSKRRIEKIHVTLL